MDRRIQFALLCASVAFGLLFALAGSVSAEGSAPPWSYDPADPNGPEHWGEILNSDGETKYAKCLGGPDGFGDLQTPIRIENAVLEQESVLEIEYRKKVRLAVENDGRKLLIDTPKAKDQIFVEGQAYQLRQIHVHTPSEHIVDGRTYAMEAHFVHVSSENAFAVVAVFFELGETNRILKKIFDRAPRDRTGYVIGKKNAHRKFRLTDLLPDDLDYYYYWTGSLTNPPCGVVSPWFLIKQPLTVSEDQVSQYETILMDVQDFPTNARPVQAGQSRPIHEVAD